MPGLRCAVYGCNNTQYLNKTMHTFPKSKDLVSQTIRKEWVTRCSRKDEFNPDTSRICSDHFVETDYERDLQNELLGLPLRKKLKKTAVPTVCLMKKTKKISTSAISRQERLAKRRRNEVVEKLICNATIIKQNVTEIQMSQINKNNKSLEEDSNQTVSPILKNINKEIETNTAEDIRLESIYENINEDKTENINLFAPSTSGTSYPAKNTEKEFEEKYRKLLDDHNNLKLELSHWRQNSNKKIKALNDQVRYFKAKSFKSPKVNKTQIEYKNLLRQILTENQIALLSSKKKRVNWTNEEISLAFTLRYYSKKCYLYINNNLHYPLPSLSTLKKWALKLNVSQGILKDVLLMLNLAGESFSDFEKTVVIQFDEVKVKSVQEYDAAKDEVVGPHNQMQVVMARGLFSQWKQPVYIDFDQRMTKEILFEIITELHKISYNVVACVSDCGASNVGLWNELNVNIENTSFRHPVTNKNIYMFADAPHLLKLLRNWLIDKGFKLEDGSIINKAPLQALINLTDGEVNSCWKVSQKHLDCEKSQRQNVRLAAQLLSNTISTGLLHYKPGSNKQMAEKLGLFIQDINYWFDIFNSYTPRGKISSKHAYGLDIVNQMNHLDKMLKLITNMRAVGKNALQIFQKGMIISIKSLRNLYSDLKNDLNIAYICTHRLNQDSLENFFFQIRSRGGPDEHPSPLAAIYRIRMIMLGKNPGVFDSKVNTEAKVLDEYIVPKVLETANIKVSAELPATNESVSSSSFSSTSSNSPEPSKLSHSMSADSFFSAEEVTEDALEYIAGYLANKYKQTLPFLGQRTYKIKEDHNYKIPSWVQQLSFGGLMKPTEQWLKKVKKWNSYFENHHGNSLRKGPGVVKILTNKMFKKDNELPLCVLNTFCKLRTIIRINFQNLQEKQNKATKRKSETSNESRKKIKKINKIIT